MADIEGRNVPLFCSTVTKNLETDCVVIRQKAELSGWDEEEDEFIEIVITGTSKDVLNVSLH